MSSSQNDSSRATRAHALTNLARGWRQGELDLIIAVVLFFRPERSPRCEPAPTTLDIRTANPHRALIQHTCTEELTATYLVGQRADLRYRLFDGADNRLWGDVFDVDF